MNYWFVARPNELFLDIDNVSRSIKHAKSRLQGAIECGKLDVAYVMQRPSKSKNHIHVIITLKHDMIYGVDRFVWEMVLHGDLYRGFCNIMRERKGITSPDVLISPWKHFGIEIDTVLDTVNNPRIRIHDDSCNCASKHNASVMETCPAAKRLRGEFRNVGFFGRPSKSPCTIWPDL
jgi:hypothetical protein